MTFWEALLKFIKEDLPGWLASFGLGYQVGASGKKAVENEKARLELENEKLKNADLVRDRNTHRDSVDIVGEIPGVGPPINDPDGTFRSGDDGGGADR